MGNVNPVVGCLLVVSTLNKESENKEEELKDDDQFRSEVSHTLVP